MIRKTKSTKMGPKKSGLSKKSLKAKKMAATRESETDVKREERLIQDRKRAAVTRESETDVKREERLSQMRLHASIKLSRESSQKRKEKLIQKRLFKVNPKDTKTEKCIAFPTNNAAFSYDPSTPYDEDRTVDIGKMSRVCPYCKALKYAFESDGMCCSAGKVRVPLLEPPPKPIKDLLSGKSPKSNSFLKHIRQYNSAFQMTSFGVSKMAIQTGFMSTFRIQGQVSHYIGSLLPESNEKPKFLQIYFVGNSDQECGFRCDTISGVDRDVIMDIQHMLHAKNHLVQSFKTAIEHEQRRPNMKVVINADKRPAGEHVRRYNAPNTNDVAVVLIDEGHNHRDIALKVRSAGVKTVSETHRWYDSLQYPLIFCEGQDGYHFNIPQVNPKTGFPNLSKKVSCNDFYASMIMVKEGCQNFLLLYRELFLQFLVDMYAKVESERLLYFRLHQTELRAECYIHLKDELATGADVKNIGQKVILPSTFTGSPRYMHERTQDAMTYVRTHGTPDLFITFTCNPKWIEIQCELQPGQMAHHRHDIVARVFRQKLLLMMRLFKDRNIFGETLCHMYTVEWQKRGLPHAHILLWLKVKIRPNQIDDIVCAELPDEDLDPVLFEVIKTQMVHGPCGKYNPKSPCMANGKCSKKYPKPFIANTQTGENGYPMYRRRMPDHGGFQTIIGQQREVQVDNRWIVPYNPLLCKIFKAHINVEYCNSIKSIKYVCKYVNKGSDMAMVGLQQEQNDEIKCYQMARYISSNEAVWRLLKFPIHERFPAVIHLSVHLENGQRVLFNPKSVQIVAPVPPVTTLTAFFTLCETDPFAATLLYPNVVKYYTWDCTTKPKCWKRRKRGQKVDGWLGVVSENVIGRVYTIHPNNKECFYLRLLLHTVVGPTSFESLKTFNGEICNTYKEACQRHGLLHDDSHWDSTMNEAAILCTSFQMRNLFAILLQFCDLANPLKMWEKHRFDFSEDLFYRFRSDSPMTYTYDPILEEQVYNECLVLIENQICQMGGQNLKYYGLPPPVRDGCNLSEDVSRELSYHIDINEVSEQNKQLLAEQRQVFDTIYDSIEEFKGGLFFIDAPGGTGKTFLLNHLLSKVRLAFGIALATASSGIAATLLIGGRTAHSTFKLPFNILENETPICKISKQSSRGKLLQEARLIVWDECTMSHRKHVEALDRTLQDLKGNSKLMGGTTVVMAGDFRQTLPVITRGTKADELKACLKSSYLWNHVHNLFLTTNMRAKLNGDKSASIFSDQLLCIGDGKLPMNNGLHILPCGQFVKDETDLLNHVFPEIETKYTSHDWLCERAILAPRNDTVDNVNRVLLKKIPGEEYEFLSNDSVDDISEAVNFPTEFLNSLQPQGVPPHRLYLKKGAPIMLLRNLDPPRLCNGTRLVIRTLQKHIIEATIINGMYVGTIVAIPRIPMIPTDVPFSFKRLQFPLRLSFAMSINKSQGQSLKVVGLHLEKPCFSHGQLYVGCSRVGSDKNLFIHSTTHCCTENIVYPEALKKDEQQEMFISNNENTVDATVSQHTIALNLGCGTDSSIGSFYNEAGITTMEPSITHVQFATFDYRPVDEHWQREICKAFKWPYITSSKSQSIKSETKVRTTRKPIFHTNIKGDGNCWYRTISFIATGSETNFHTIKLSILEYMRHNAQVIQNIFAQFPFLIPPYSQVIMNDNAAIQFINYFAGENVWTDQIVMDFTSCMLKTPYYLYQRHQDIWTITQCIT